MAAPNRRWSNQALSFLFGLAPFAFGSIRALNTRSDVRMLWMALVSGAGAAAIRVLARRSIEPEPSKRFAILTFVTATLLGGITAILLGATAPAGIWLVAMVLAVCWTASYYFAARSRDASLLDPSPQALVPLQDFHVHVLERGRDGYVRYSEGSHSYDFYWEFCGAGCVVSASVPSIAKWPRELSWAADRRDEVIARVGEAMCRHSGTGCTWRLNNDWLEVVKS